MCLASEDRDLQRSAETSTDRMESNGLPNGSARPRLATPLAALLRFGGIWRCRFEHAETDCECSINTEMGPKEVAIAMFNLQTGR